MINKYCQLMIVFVLYAGKLIHKKKDKKFDLIKEANKIIFI